MERYILEPEDRIRLLREQPPAVELLCGRSMIFFDLAAIRETCRSRGSGMDALQFTGPDALLGQAWTVLVPVTHRDYAGFLRALCETAPHLTPTREEAYLPSACDHRSEKQ